MKQTIRTVDRGGGPDKRSGKTNIPPCSCTSDRRTLRSRSVLSGRRSSCTDCSLTDNAFQQQATGVVLPEELRVLAPGGRIGIFDVVADDHLTAVGFTGIEITPTHPVADGMHSAVVRAGKPSAVP